MKRFVVLIAIVLAVTVVWIAGWMFIADRVRDEVAALSAGDGVTTPRLECGTLLVGGFPFQFAPRCVDAQLTVGDLEIEVADVIATALFYRPQHIQILATGPARVTDAFTGATQEARWRNLHASLRLSGDRLTRFSAVADDLLYADVLFGDVVLAQATRGEIHLIEATDADAPETAGSVFDFYTLFDGMDAPSLDIASGRVTLDARLTGVPEMGLWGHPELLRLWEMAGGMLTLRGLEASADGLMLSVDGEARIDAAGLLQGRLDVASRGIVERFEGPAEDPRVPMLLGQPDSAGVYSQTVAIRNGRVSVGIIPLQDIPPLF